MRTLALLITLLAAAASAGAQPSRPHNVVLFVADGLRGRMVTPVNAPAMYALKTRGVWFPNSHSLFPTFTTANASAIATGHGLGDTGDFSNSLYVGFPVRGAGGSPVAFIENNGILAELDAHFGGNYLNEATVIESARAAGYSTAVVGKLGPARIFDHRGGADAVVIDDNTGHDGGLPLPAGIVQAMTAAGLPTATPPRHGGDPHVSPLAGQQRWMTDVVARVLLPEFRQRGRPFLLVFWSRDPDGSQHGQTDGLGQLVPGINGPASLAGIHDADDSLSALQRALADAGLADTTDIIITSDHGFSVVAKDSRDAATGRVTQLPRGFAGRDLAAALALPAFDPDAAGAPVPPGSLTTRGNWLLGGDPHHPQVVVAANGGSDLIYLPGRDRALAGRVAAALQAHDYTSGVFVDDRLGPIPGTLPLSAIGLAGSAVTPRPAVVVGFRTFVTGGGCPEPTNCQAEIADTSLQVGQGMHGSFGRGDTLNFTAAAGPDFRQHFVDPAPASNADVGRTVARLLGVKTTGNGKLIGRVLTEAMPGGAMPKVTPVRLTSPPGPGGAITALRGQRAGGVDYYDAAGTPGRTVGLEPYTVLF